MMLPKNVVLMTSAGVVATAVVAVAGYNIWQSRQQAPAPQEISTPAVRAPEPVVAAPAPVVAAPAPVVAPPAPVPAPAVVARVEPPPPPAPAPVVATPAPPPAVVARAPEPAPAPAPPPPGPVVTSPEVKPAFDVVRVEPTGDAVVAGRAEPESRIALIDRGKVIAEVKTDKGGQFAVLPPTMAPGEHELALRMTTGSGETVSEQSVTVLVPNRSDGKVIVALTAPDAPTVILNEPRQAPPPPKVAPPPPQQTALATPAPAVPAPQVFIRSVEVGEDGGFFASGTAAPGATVLLYLNGSNIATVTAGADGHWTLKVARGLTPGTYVVRADHVESATGKVLARAEVPFEFRGLVVAEAAPKAPPPPAALVVAPAPPPVVAAAPAVTAPAVAPAPVTEPQPRIVTAPAAQVATRAATPATPADAFVEDLKTVTVTRGDSLWRISRKVYGRGIRYTVIFDANATQIRDRDRIYPGQVFVVPKS